MIKLNGVVQGLKIITILAWSLPSNRQDLASTKGLRTYVIEIVLGH
jgi:hypothetical protein